MLNLFSKIALTTALIFSIASYASSTKQFDSCTKVADNTYHCTLDRKTDIAKIRGYACDGDTCMLYASPRKYKSSQGKGDVIYGYNNMAYALCSKAQCTLDKKNPKMAYCNCPVINTKNQISSISLGPFNRAKSLPVYDAYGNMAEVTSTYSLMNVFDFKNKLKANKEITLCKYEQNYKWADCFGAKCKVDQHNPLNSVCHCPVLNTKSFVSVGGECHLSSDKIIAGGDPEQFEETGIYIMYRHFGWVR